MNFEAWKALGYDQNSIIVADTASIKFKGIPSDFGLAEGSPGIDKGKSFTDIKEDILGILRPRGAGFDIGAFEH